jgi:hypothetical protein
VQLCVEALNTFDVDVLGTRLQDSVLMYWQLSDVKLEGRILCVHDLRWYGRSVVSELSGVRFVLPFLTCRTGGGRSRSRSFPLRLREGDGGWTF